MNMNKTCMFAAIPLLGIATASCGVEEGENTGSWGTKVLQLVIPDDATQQVIFQKDHLYQVSINYNTSSLTILSNDIEAGGVKGDFRTDVIPYVYGYNGVSESYFFSSKNGGMLGQSAPISDISGYMITYRPTWINNGMNTISSLVMSYDVPGARVVTMQPEPRFFGPTVTYYPTASGTDESSTTEDASYGIVFADDMKHATVTIYSVRFAPNAPKLESVVLKDLDVTLGQHGYTISGADIVPLVPEGGTSGTMVEYRKFPFKSFEFKSAGKYLTEAECKYEVTATIGERQMLFRATFSGKSSDYVVFGTDDSND